MVSPGANAVPAPRVDESRGATGHFWQAPLAPSQPANETPRWRCRSKRDALHAQSRSERQRGSSGTGSSECWDGFSPHTRKGRDVESMHNRRAAVFRRAPTMVTGRDDLHEMDGHPGRGKRAWPREEERTQIEREDTITPASLVLSVAGGRFGTAAA